MTRRGVARRFGIAPSTAIKWVSAWRRTGSWRPRAQGAENFAILRSIITTARKQGWNIIDALMSPSDRLIATVKCA